MREHMLIGASRELAVAADLARRGFEVFLGHGNLSCDMVAYKFGIFVKIEVKGGSERPYRGAPCGRSSTKASTHCERFDVLATVDAAYTVQYNRSIYHEHNAASLELSGEDAYSKCTTHKIIARALHIQQGEGHA